MKKNSFFTRKSILYYLSMMALAMSLELARKGISYRVKTQQLNPPTIEKLAQDLENKYDLTQSKSLEYALAEASLKIQFWDMANILFFGSFISLSSYITWNSLRKLLNSRDISSRVGI